MACYNSNVEDVQILIDDISCDHSTFVKLLQDLFVRLAGHMYVNL